MTATVLIFSGLVFLVVLGSAAILRLSAIARAAQTERRKKLVEHAMAGLSPKERIEFKKEILSKIDSALHSKK